VDGRRTVGPEAFAKIAPACPAMAHPITVRNLFEVLTSSTGGRLHFLIYHKYLKNLDQLSTSIYILITRSSLHSLKTCYASAEFPAMALLPYSGIFLMTGCSTLQYAYQVGTKLPRSSSPKAK
jgi:predicted membrane channel-forming protein YqfA (hemolysin III family)